MRSSVGDSFRVFGSRVRVVADRADSIVGNLPARSRVRDACDRLSSPLGARPRDGAAHGCRAGPASVVVAAFEGPYRRTSADGIPGDVEAHAVAVTGAPAVAEILDVDGERHRLRAC